MSDPCPRCEAQGATITKLARELAEARIALMRVREMAEVTDHDVCVSIRTFVASCLPIDVDGKP